VSDLSRIDSVAGVTIYSVRGAPASFLFKAGATIDADGSPTCYGPDNSGDDYTANGGDDNGGNWWGGPIGKDGKPIVQKIYEPAPGYYVCSTAHVVPGFSDSIQYRYIDSKSIPFFVLPGNHANGARLGDCGLCYSLTGENCYGCYADVGPSSKIGEVSQRMAEALKLNPNPKSGGIVLHEIVYLVFPGSMNGWQPPNVWFNQANNLFGQWGGLSRLRELLKEL
jgi:hypothetical protein